MPLKKPKPVKLPAPFKDLETSEDDDTRRRALLMKRELQQVEGFSWNAPAQTPVERIRRNVGRHFWPALAATGMGALLISAFVIAANTGVEAPLRVVYVESWRGTRTAEEAVAAREEAMDVLRAEVAENRRLLAEAQARQQALDAERAAARQASPN